MWLGVGVSGCGGSRMGMSRGVRSKGCGDVTGLKSVGVPEDFKVLGVRV